MTDFVISESSRDYKKIQKGRESIGEILDAKNMEYIELQKDCYFSRMTGSGSTCYGMFKNKKKAMNALKIIRRKLPNFWCVITKTI